MSYSGVRLQALSIDPRCAYAHTLIGHEYAVNEDFEKAMMSFRTALSCDDRHYNAWYGLGTVFFREEKYDLAEYHFKRAVVINSRNPVLHCYLGMVRYTRFM